MDSGKGGFSTSTTQETQIKWTFDSSEWPKFPLIYSFAGNPKMKKLLAYEPTMTAKKIPAWGGGELTSSSSSSYSSQNYEIKKINLAAPIFYLQLAFAAIMRDTKLFQSVYDSTPDCMKAQAVNSAVIAGQSPALIRMLQQLEIGFALPKGVTIKFNEKCGYYTQENARGTYIVIHGHDYNGFSKNNRSVELLLKLGYNVLAFDFRFKDNITIKDITDILISLSITNLKGISIHAHGSVKNNIHHITTCHGVSTKTQSLYEAIVKALNIKTPVELNLQSCQSGQLLLNLPSIPPSSKMFVDADAKNVSWGFSKKILLEITPDIEPNYSFGELLFSLYSSVYDTGQNVIKSTEIKSTDTTIISKDTSRIFDTPLFKLLNSQHVLEFLFFRSKLPESEKGNYPGYKELTNPKTGKILTYDQTLRYYDWWDRQPIEVRSFFPKPIELAGYEARTIKAFFCNNTELPLSLIDEYSEQAPLAKKVTAKVFTGHKKPKVLAAKATLYSILKTIESKEEQEEEIEFTKA